MHLQKMHIYRSYLKQSEMARPGYTLPFSKNKLSILKENYSLRQQNIIAFHGRISGNEIFG